MITTKELRKSIADLHLLSDLMVQKDRQVDFWRTQARNQMKRNNKLQKQLADLEK